MGGLVAFIIGLAIIIGIFNAITDARLWGEILVVVTFIVGISIWRSHLKKTKENEKKEREARADHQREQESLRSKAQDLLATSQRVVEVIPNNITLAEEALNEAEMEFSEGAFAPFWDAVEKAVINLGHFDQDVKDVVANSERHSKCIAAIDNHKPGFSISLDSLPDPRSTSQRLQAIVRNAQKDFQFATIYEQRKTNQILVAGFGNLASAINYMGDRISASISDLSDTITVSFSEQNEFLGKINETLATESNERRKHEEREIEILDNIQSRRKPTRVIPNLRDGDWDKK